MSRRRSRTTVKKPDTKQLKFWHEGVRQRGRLALTRGDSLVGSSVLAWTAVVVLNKSGFVVHFPSATCETPPCIYYSVWLEAKIFEVFKSAWVGGQKRFNSGELNQPRAMSVRQKFYPQPRRPATEWSVGKEKRWEELLLLGGGVSSYPTTSCVAGLFLV